MTDPHITTEPARLLPANNEIEQALLGEILYDNAAYDAVGDFLKPEHFADELHGRIYEAAVKVIDRNERATVLSLRALFEDDEPLNGMKGPQYLIELYDSAGSTRDAGSHGTRRAEGVQK